MAAIREVIVSDYERLALFLKNNGRRKESQQQWLSRFFGWWEANPAFSESKTPRGWILLVADSIEGFVGVIPIEIWVKGEIETLFSITTWRVTDEHRINSLGLIQKIMEIGNGHILMCTTPNDRVQAVLEKMHFSPLHKNEQLFANIYPGRLYVAFVWIRAVLKMEHKLSLKALIGIANWCKNLVGEPAKPTERHEFNIREVGYPDSEFDNLWLRTRSQYRMTQARTLAYVKWQLSFKDFDRRILLGCYRSTQLMGFIFLRPLKKKRDLYYECVDFWSAADALKVQSALLSGAVHVANKKGALGVRFPIVSSEVSRLVRKYHGVTIGQYPNIEKIKFPMSDGIGDNGDADNLDYFTRLTGEYGL